eukprot:m51a1_g8321 hypothetical protein (316) ;mRNA; f:127411-128601
MTKSTIRPDIQKIINAWRCGVFGPVNTVSAAQRRRSLAVRPDIARILDAWHSGWFEQGNAANTLPDSTSTGECSQPSVPHFSTIPSSCLTSSEAPFEPHDHVAVACDDFTFIAEALQLFAAFPYLGTRIADSTPARCGASGSEPEPPDESLVAYGCLQVTVESHEIQMTVTPPLPPSPRDVSPPLSASHSDMDSQISCMWSPMPSLPPSSPTTPAVLSPSSIDFPSLSPSTSPQTWRSKRQRDSAGTGHSDSDAAKEPGTKRRALASKSGLDSDMLPSPPVSRQVVHSETPRGSAAQEEKTQRKGERPTPQRASE